MIYQAHDSQVLAELEPTQSSLLRECLSFAPALPARNQPAEALPFDERSRKIERLKMYRPREAAQQAEHWLQETLEQARRALEGKEEITLFCSALSTWGAVQRNLGQVGDAAQAQLHALRLLQPQLYTTRAGFVLHRIAFVLADLGDVTGGLISSHQAIAVHELTPGGEHNVAVATSGLAALHLFYRRAFAAARLAYRSALEALAPFDDLVHVFGANHGLAYSHLMEGDVAVARDHLSELRRAMPKLDADQDLRLSWMAAEIAAADGDQAGALNRYAEIFPRAIEIMEPAGPVLLALDATALLVGSERTAEAAQWHRWLEPIVEQLGAAQKAAIEPYLDALSAGGLDRHLLDRGLDRHLLDRGLDRHLLDRTAVAFKSATNRMLLGMGRPQAAGRPELMGQIAA